MFSLLLIKQMDELLFAGNPLPLKVAISPYNQSVARLNLYVVASVQVEMQPGTATFKEVKAQKLFPDGNGFIDLDISSIAFAWLDYYVPAVDQLGVKNADGQAKRFRVKFTLFLNNDVIDEETTDSFAWLIKGGESYEHHWGERSVNDWMVENPRPLIHSNTDRMKVFPEDKFFIYFINPYGEWDNLRVYAEIFYVQDNVYGSTSSEPIATVAVPSETEKYKLCCLPAGLSQIVHPTPVPDGAEPYKYVLNFQKNFGDTEETLFPPVEIHLDTRNFYNTHQLLYRNSLGSLEPLRLRGQVDFEADYEYQQAKQVPSSSYPNFGNLEATVVQDYAEETPKYKADTGFHRPVHAEQLRDLFLSKQVFEVKDGRLIPVVLNKNNIKFFANNENLISLQIEWRHAFSNEFYTKEPANLNECATPLKLVVTQTGNDKLTVFWAFAYGSDEGQLSITFPAEDPIIFPITGRSGKIEVETEIAHVAEVELEVKIRGLCHKNTAAEGYSAWLTAAFDMQPEVVPIAVPDTINIPIGNDAPVIIGNLLENDFDPEGEAIEAVVQTGVASAQAGEFSLAANGDLTYTAPSSSFTGTDSLTYTIKRTGSSEVSDAATVSINIGVNAANTFAKLFIKNQVTHANGDVTAEVWVELFSDPACQVRKTVTSLSINFRTVETVNGGSPTTNDDSIAVVGDRRLLFNGFLRKTEGADVILVVYSLLTGTGYTRL
jgi:hypothetical protein